MRSGENLVKTFILKAGIHWFCAMILALLPVTGIGQFPANFANYDDHKVFFSHLTREHGLPSDFTLCSLQDFRGYVWIATDNGLARFDGKNITVFRYRHGVSTSIVDNYVVTLQETQDSMLWIGTRNGISIFNPFTSSFRSFPFIPGGRGTFPCRFVRQFFEDQDGVMWIATDDGLVRGEAEKARFTCVLSAKENLPGDKESSYGFFTSIIPDPEDRSRLYLGTQSGLMLFDKRSATVISRFPKVFNDRTALFCLFSDGDHVIWAGGWSIGLNRFDLRTKEWSSFPGFSKEPITVLGIHPKNDREFWLSTLGSGIGVFDKQTGRFGFIRHDPRDARSLISDYINHISFFNTSGELCATSPDGVSIERRNINLFGILRPPFRFSAITAILNDQRAGKLYAGAWRSEGLFILDRNNGKWQLAPPEEPVGNTDFLINGICRDRQGTIWLATSRNLMYLDTLKRKIRKYRNGHGSEVYLTDGQVYMPYEDQAGFLWIGTRSDGIIRLSPDRRNATVFTHRSHDPASLAEGRSYRAQWDDQNGRVWITDYGSVSIFDAKEQRFNNSFMDTLRRHGFGDKHVFQIMEDTTGRIWMTIDGLGLLQAIMHKDGSYSFKLFETTQGLNASGVSTMCCDREGDFWINNISLLHFNPYTGTFKQYDTRNGLRSMLSVGQTIYVDDDLNIYIGSELGIEVKNKHAFTPSKEIINLVVEAVEINGNRQAVGYSRNGVSVFKLKANQNNVTFFFTAISFDDVSSIKYMYRLDGYDDDWYLSEHNREARYMRLPPGDYQFQFRTLNQHDWKEKEHYIVLNIKPFIWQTWWFLLMIVLGIASLGYVVYIYRVRQLLRLERLRSRIATDLHDDVGSTLSSISIMSEMLAEKAADSQSVRMLKIIGDNSAHMMEKLDDIVWVVNPSNDKVHDLRLRINEYVIPLLEVKKIRFIQHFDPQLTGQRIPMDIRRNVYLIAKEAINNALKYSGCNELVLIFKADHGGFLMEIRDNGKGFDPEQQSTRNGLKNIHLRAKQIRADLRIITGPGLGACVRLHVPRHRHLLKSI